MNVLAALGERSARIARAVVPDPFVLAIGLGAVALLCGSLVGRVGPLDLVGVYATGFLDPPLLAFGFEMALVLLTGHAVAEAPLVRGGLRRLADRPATTAQAGALVAAVAMALALLNWGLGLVAGAFLAREVGRSFRRRGLPLAYPLVGAAGYMGIAVWHGGLSGSAPLKVAAAGSYGAAVPVTATTFSTLNLVTTPVVAMILVAFFWALGAGASSSTVAPPPDVDDAEPPHDVDRPRGVVAFLDTSALVSACVVVPVVVALAARVGGSGFAAVNLQWVILAFWMAGMVLHRGPAQYAAAFASGAREASGILLQFPLYFGIVAVAQRSGLVDVVAGAFVQWAQAAPSPRLAGLGLTYLSAALVNLLIPSGGGQWAVQGPLVLQTANALSIDRAPLVMAFAYGDQITNLLQPFWAIPVLSVTGLKARDVMGYTILAMLVAMPLYGLGLALFA